MQQGDEIKDILVLAFLREGLAIRNNDLVEQQKKVAVSLLAHRNDIIARRKAYRAFILLERGITDDYRTPVYRHAQALHQGKACFEQTPADLEFGKKYPRIARKVFNYLKTRVSNMRQRT